MALPPEAVTRIKKHLGSIYKSWADELFVRRFLDLIEKHVRPAPLRTERWDESDIILITYGDTLLKSGEKPLHTLNSFLRRRLPEISCVHILPFFPYSSDDGFSVIDYENVDEALGTWDDIKTINEHFSLQIDLVINHVSQQNAWFQNYLQDKRPGAGYFIEMNANADLSRVVRPRSLPLLTKFKTKKGVRRLWTTFSADQIDLNFANPEVLYEMTRILLFYLDMGARIIRLDAIAFLWKELGTSCLHLPQTHEVVKLFRTIFEIIDPRLILLTETNVPNEENLSYFGDNDEANMIYQFSLPPLLLHALHTGAAQHLTAWAARLPRLGAENTFLNFTASHDGIGIRPLEGLLPDDEISSLCKNMQAFGGRISTKTNADGSSSPYEINISLFDAFVGDASGPDLWQEQRFLCSQTIMMALQGIPAFYIHSLLATPNDEQGVQRSGANRSINRRKWDVAELFPLLEGDTHHARIFNELRRRLRIRKNEPAFHPNARQEVVDRGSDIFCVKRLPQQSKGIIAISNMTQKTLNVDLSDILPDALVAIDLLSEQSVPNKSFRLGPYQSRWIKNVAVRQNNLAAE